MKDDPIEASGRGLPAGAGRARKERVTAYIWFLTGMISISGLLFGLDTGIISGILVSLGDDLGHELSNGDKELITSITTALAFVGGIAAGITSDRFGRKWLLWAADVFFIVGAIVQAVAHNVATMTAGRALLGLGVGIASCVCPLILTELSPTHLRGRLVTINVVMITLGQVIAYAIGAAFERTGGGWRWMAGLCAIPAGIQIVALVFLPDSPRQLIVKNKFRLAKNALKKIYPYETDEQLDAKIEFLQDEAALQAKILASEPLKKRVKDIILIGSNRRALTIAVGLQLFQQLSGFNTLMYYSATLFASIGFNNPTAVGLIVSGTNFIGTVLALKYIDIIGRRRVLLFSAPGMVIGLVLAAVSFHYLTLGTGGKLDPNADYPGKWSGLVLFSMVFYVFSYALGIGNIPWLQGELFPISYRGIGTSLATGGNWGSNLIISSTYLSMMDAMTPSGAFGFYAGLCFVGCVFVTFCYPNTAGLSIEETRVIFKDSFGIKAADRLRADKAAAYDAGMAQ
ncbi:general substrate transporter [Cystobasidium minutum MCA 4210]|uniref:general substrate transporter n=1 Tax=Cystobasidium minutum MCA 4210 TaxID=1397322 RepID=UPI0034CE5991|eukprot:jgi/Rhomi1/142662/e_gw1.3.1245.1